MIEHIACRTSPTHSVGNPFEAIWLFAKVVFYAKMPATLLDMIKDKIISKPNKLFEFSDDKQAVDLLFELGLIDEFSTSHPPGKTTVQVITGDLPTHFVIATRSAANLEAEGNGCWVLCIPKSQYSEEEINNHLQAIVARYQSQGMAVETMMPMLPQSSDATHRVVLRG